MTNTKDTANLGKWSRLHYDYLYRNKRTVINVMRMKGTMQAYWEPFDNDTQDSFEKLVKRTAEVENITEEVKVAILCLKRYNSYVCNFIVKSERG